mgnify:CR=1 FL=1|tara:strand:- start:3321 stop:3587 length:267 start_codon:yes stop_codon:yes gene_type:complete
METNRISLSAAEYISRLINIFKKYNYNTSDLENIEYQHQTSMPFSAPEVRTMYNDRSKAKAYEYVCLNKKLFNDLFDKELAEFFKKHT